MYNLQRHYAFISIYKTCHGSYWSCNSFNLQVRYVFRSQTGLHKRHATKLPWGLRMSHTIEWWELMIFLLHLENFNASYNFVLKCNFNLCTQKCFQNYQMAKKWCCSILEVCESTSKLIFLFIYPRALKKLHPTYDGSQMTKVFKIDHLMGHCTKKRPKMTKNRPYLVEINFFLVRLNDWWSNPERFTRPKSGRFLLIFGKNVLVCIVTPTSHQSFRIMT